MDYEELSDKNILKMNSENILKKLDLSSLNSWDEFYLYKNKTSKNFEMLLSTWNEDYMYIDTNWNKEDDRENTRKTTYKRSFSVWSDILNYYSYPSSISDLITHFDAFDIDWDWDLNDQPNDWDTIHYWIDKESWNDAYQNSNNNRPYFSTWWINNQPAVKFDTDRFFYIDDDSEINLKSSITERSYAFVIKTWKDVSTPQVVYEEGWYSRWYAIIIHNNNLWAWVWNDAEWDSGHRYKSINIWKVLPNTVYLWIVVQSSQTAVDAQNTFSIYINWFLYDSLDHVDYQRSHNYNIWLWWISEQYVRPSDNLTIAVDEWEYFKWYIWEFILWNHALSSQEVYSINNYLRDRWQIELNDIPKLNIIETNISRYYP